MLLPGNFSVLVESCDKGHFVDAMQMCFDYRYPATHYLIKGDTFTLYWGESPSSIALPYPMGVEAAIDFVWNWLNTADRGPKPDHDGSNDPDGFRVTNSKDGWNYVIVNIKAVWSEYHK